MALSNEAARASPRPEDKFDTVHLFYAKVRSCDSATTTFPQLLGTTRNHTGRQPLLGIKKVQPAGQSLLQSLTSIFWFRYEACITLCYFSLILLTVLL